LKAEATPLVGVVVHDYLGWRDQAGLLIMPMTTFATEKDAAIIVTHPRSMPVNQFQFGQQVISTKVHMMVPRTAQPEYIDVLSAMHDHTSGQDIFLMMHEDYRRRLFSLKLYQKGLAEL